MPPVPIHLLPPSWRPVLILQALLEIVDQRFGRQAVQLVLIHPQRIGYGLGVLEPLSQQGPGDVVDLQARCIGQVGALEIMGKDLVEKIEIPFALDQNGPRGGVEFIQGRDEAIGQGPVQGQKGRGVDRHAHLFELVEKGQEHDQKRFRRLTKELARS